MLCSECQVTQQLVWKWIHLRSIWQADGDKTYSRKRKSNRNAPRLRNQSMFKMERGAPYEIWQALFLIWKGSCRSWYGSTVESIRFTFPCPLTLSWGLILSWELLILPKPVFLGLAVYSAETYPVCFYLTESNESTDSFLINIMPWERLQQQTRQRRFPGPQYLAQCLAHSRHLMNIHWMNTWRWLGWGCPGHGRVSSTMFWVSETRLPSHQSATVFNFSWPMLYLNLIHTLKIIDHYKYLGFPLWIPFSGQIFIVKRCEATSHYPQLACKDLLK